MSIKTELTYDPANPSDVSATATGSETVPVYDTDEGLAQFGLTKDDIREGLKIHFGKKPDGISTGYDNRKDEYEDFGWTPVTATVRPVSCVVGNSTLTPVTAKTTTLSNDSSSATTESATLSVEVANGMSQTWSTEFTIGISFTAEATYGSEAAGGSVSASSTLSASTTVGESNEVSQTVSYGSENNVTQELQPGESKVVEMNINKLSVDVTTTYEVTFSGTCMAHYDEKRKADGHYQSSDKHFYYGCSMTEVVEDAGFNMNTLTYEMTTTVDYYFDESIIVTDA